MVKEPIDAEKIGAVLDGTAGQERDELLARLAADEDDYDVFADTAAVLREIEEEGAAVAVPEIVASTESPATAEADVIAPTEVPAGPRAVAASPAERAAAPEAATADVIPLRPRRPNVWAKPGVRWLAAAAVMVAVAVPVLRLRGGADAWRDPRKVAAMATAGEDAPADVIATRPWIVTRGGEGTGEPMKGSSAKVGTLHADLVVAAIARGPRDAAAIHRFAGEAATTIQKIEQAGLEFVALQYLQVDSAAGAPRAQLLSTLNTARSQAEEYLDRDYFALGAWTEAARLAAGRQNAEFFSDKRTKPALERAANLEGLSDAGKTAAQAITAMVDREGGIQDWPALNRDLTTLHEALVRAFDPLPPGT